MESGTAGDLPLGAILAGGRSRRFGSPKALSEVGGVAMVHRVRSALERAGARAVLIAELPELRALDLPSRSDRVRGAGPLGGIHAALHWARELEQPGALCVACDMPFLAPGLLAGLIHTGMLSGAAAVAPRAAPEAEMEPLCAWYSVAALDEVEARLRGGEWALRPLLRAVGARALPTSEVMKHGSPERLLANVNTPADRQRAEALADSGAISDEHA